jgi:hypothetical protein
MSLVHEWAIAAKHTLTKAPEVRIKHWGGHPGRHSSPQRERPRDYPGRHPPLTLGTEV